MKDDNLKKILELESENRTLRASLKKAELALSIYRLTDPTFRSLSDIKLDGQINTLGLPKYFGDEACDEIDLNIKGSE